MGRKYTRKQLKKPDEFITLTHRAWAFVQARARGTLINVGVALAIIAAIAALNAYRERRAQRAGHALARAIDIYNRSVGEDATPAEGDDLPTFKTRKEKLARADKELTAIVDGPGVGDVPRLARLVRAGVRFQQGRHDDAIADYKAALDGEDDPTLRYEAIEGLLYCYEAQKKWDQALAQARKLPDDGDDAEARRLFQRARLLAQQGKKKEAVALFRQARQKAGSMLLKAFAGNRLAMLEE